MKKIFIKVSFFADAKNAKEVDIIYTQNLGKTFVYDYIQGIVKK